MAVYCKKWAAAVADGLPAQKRGPIGMEHGGEVLRAYTKKGPDAPAPQDK